jgi:hypothetical protein
MADGSECAAVGVRPGSSAKAGKLADVGTDEDGVRAHLAGNGAYVLLDDGRALVVLQLHVVAAAQHYLG